MKKAEYQKRIAFLEKEYAEAEREIGVLKSNLKDTEGQLASVAARHLSFKASADAVADAASDLYVDALNSLTGDSSSSGTFTTDLCKLVDLGIALYGFDHPSVTQLLSLCQAPEGKCHACPKHIGERRKAMSNQWKAYGIPLAVVHDSPEEEDEDGPTFQLLVTVPGGPEKWEKVWSAVEAWVNGFEGKQYRINESYESEMMVAATNYRNQRNVWGGKEPTDVPADHASAMLLNRLVAAGINLQNAIREWSGPYNDCAYSPDPNARFLLRVIFNQFYEYNELMEKGR